MKRGKKKKIILEKTKENTYTITIRGSLSYGEILDAILGAYCRVANIGIKNGTATEIMKDVAIKTLDKLLAKEGTPS